MDPEENSVDTGIPCTVANVTLQVENKEQIQIHQLQSQDPCLQEIITYLKEGMLPNNARDKRIVLGKERFTLIDDVLYFVDPSRKDRPRLAVPEAMKEPIMKENHSGAFSGHFSARGLYEKLTRRFWWDGMYSDIHHHCRACLTCAALSTLRTPYQVDIDDCKLELVTGLTESWKIARTNIACAQKHQKTYYDKKAKKLQHVFGGRVMVYMPYEDQGKN